MKGNLWRTTIYVCCVEVLDGEEFTVPIHRAVHQHSTVQFTHDQYSAHNLSANQRTDLHKLVKPINQRYVYKRSFLQNDLHSHNI